MQKAIKIEEVSQRQSANGKKYFLLRGNGATYFFWKQQLPEGVAEGSDVIAECEDGKYPKIRDMRPAANDNASIENAVAVVEPEMTRDERVFRAVALKAAAEVYGGTDVSNLHILQTADYFLQWLNGRAH